MLGRFSLELTDGANVRLWQSFRANLPVGDSLRQLGVVNAAVNSFPYVSDDVNWGKLDYWETPIEFLQHAGDCEDFAITKYMTLRSLGLAAENMRVAVVTDTQLRVAHAVLLVMSGGKLYVLDNLTNEVLPATAEPFYRPVYAINEDGWWNYGPQVAGTPAGMVNRSLTKYMVSPVGVHLTLERKRHGLIFHGQMDFVAYRS